MPKVTLVIATCNRPAFLRDALESLRRQTAREALGQVIVSENGTTDLSREVCGEFQELPLLYLQQRPPVPALLHLKAIWPHVQHPVVAILHDDDWWSPGHLETALGFLLSHPSCAAVYSHYNETFGPRFPFVASDAAWLVWIASGCDFGRPALVLDEGNVIMSCLFNACFHYSTLVGWKEAIWDAYLKVVETGNAFDNDRTFPVFLSSHGSIGYLTSPGVFVRFHSSQDQRQLKYQEKLFHFVRETTRMLLKTEPTKVARAVEKFNETMARLGPDKLPRRLRQAIFDRVHEPQWTTLVEECGLKLPPREQFIPCQPPQRPVPSSPRDSDSLLKEVCPPEFLAVERRLEGAPTTLQRNQVEMLPSVTVIIPTSNRVSHLHEALRSVHRQTARQAIARVIVLGSNGSDESKGVGAELADLPVTYAQQKSPVTASHDLKAALTLVRSPLVAVLKDGDWWSPEHLEAALAVLKSNQDCAAVFSNFYETQGPEYPVLTSLHAAAWRVWISSGCDFGQPVEILDEVSVMLSCLLDSTFHFSTLVCRSEALLEAYARVVACGDCRYAERIFPIFLVSHGGIGYVTAPDVYVRVDGAQVFAPSDYWQECQLKSATTHWLVTNQPAKAALAVARFNQAAGSLPATPVLSHPASPALSTLSMHLGDPQRSTLKVCGFQIAGTPRKGDKTKWFLKQWCPPACLTVAKAGWRAIRRFPQQPK
jgi:glycosyltransferase involved in cell wall biosynthesis